MALAVGAASVTFGAGDHRSIGPASDSHARRRQPGPPGVTVDNRERWRINPDRSTLRFSVGQQVLRGLRGVFHCWGGQLLLDRGGTGLSVFRLWVDLSSFDAGSAKHDERIVAAGLFDAPSEPALVFDSERVQMTDTRHGVAVGRLAVHCVGMETAMSIDAEAPQCDARGVWHLVFNARTSVHLSALRRSENRSRGGWLNHLVWGEVVQIGAHVEASRDTRVPVGAPILGVPGSMGGGRSLSSSAGLGQ